MDYERLPVILKRYSFIEKMRVLQYYSKQIMNINGIELTSGQPMAWKLEIFLLFAVKADEYNDNDFKGKNINKFIEMINCIKEHQHPTLVNKICNLYDIERYVFTNTDIIKALKKQIKTKSPYDYALSNSKTNSILKNDNVYSFKKNIINSIRKITDELVKVGLLKKN